jgi:ElaB/YqjD/DUF883 family membrane-anchored ribosome-binding protein
MNERDRPLRRRSLCIATRHFAWLEGSELTAPPIVRDAFPQEKGTHHIMQETMNVQSTSQHPKSSEPTVRAKVSEELNRLRDELSRTANEMRMKTKDASAEVQDTRKSLEQEVKRFSAEVDQAVERTQEDLVQVGKDLRTRFQKLAHQIARPSS